MTLARSAGRLTAHDPEYDRRTGRLVCRFDFEAPVVMTEQHVASAVMFAAGRVKHTAEIHDLGEISWPPAVEVRPYRSLKGATLELEVRATECRTATWLQ